MGVAPQPVTDDEADALFAGLKDKALVLAVSGGCDSTALMHLVADWARRLVRTGPDGAIIVVTVDHGLRPQACEEAETVARAAHALALECRVLRWRGPHPAAGIQAAARQARYRLIGELLMEMGREGRTWHLVTAHHRDDQAETVLMRLARGSGIDGLGGMQPRGEMAGIGDGNDPGFVYPILRPLLDVPRSRLEATLRARGIDWIDDPSNDIDAFERVRMRKLLTTLDPLGLTAEALARSARRLRRARAAIEAFAGTAIEDIDWHHGTHASIAAPRLDALPDEIGLRVLSHMLAGMGGVSPPPRLSEIEALWERMSGGADAGAATGHAATLGGCRVDWAADTAVRVWREAGRDPMPRCTIEPGGRVVWDGRFAIEVAADGQAIEVGPVGRVTSEQRSVLGIAGDLPPGAAETLAAAWFDGELRVLLLPGQTTLPSVAVTFVGAAIRRQAG